MKRQFLNALMVLGLVSFMAACSGSSKKSEGAATDSTKTEKNDNGQNKIPG